ncbi:hypothetical protein [Persicobacter diffluens]|uniref:HTH araC/xylS-type domain-containing protein n=1 Tax=Persicobacter diffluens TaxID=981 RepID=A0AAN5AK97_9BACT|nr:hypothetical protein PEDI_23610 [Persicobacter diffluens]
MPGDIIPTVWEREFIIQNIKSIYQEANENDGFSDAIISGALASVLNVMARSIEKKYVDSANDREEKFWEILRYINGHLHDNDQLKLTLIADLFGISKTYFSEYFKKHTGLTLAENTMRAKLRIVQMNAIHTD